MTRMKKTIFDEEQKEEHLKIVISLLAFIAAVAAEQIFRLETVFAGRFGWVFPFVIFFAIYLICGAEIIAGALKGIFKEHEFLGEEFLMMIASLGAFALGIYNGISGGRPEGFEEGCAVVIFFEIGEFFQELAVSRSEKSISDLMDIRPDRANLIIAASGGETRPVNPADVSIGERIAVLKGEKVPLDGVIVSIQSENVESGTSQVAILDMMALNGESVPVQKCVGETALSGSICLSARIEMEVVKPFAESTVSKILELTENVSGRKTRTENFVDRFAAIYTPVVVCLCVLLAVIPSLVTGQWDVWIYRALSLLVVSCPCALVISIPLSFFVGVGTASKNHILVKGTGYLETISKANIFVCDKTGTLTEGRRKKLEDDPFDPLREGTQEFIDAIRKKGLRAVMLSGDKEEIAADTAREAGISEYRSGLLPQDKVAELEKYMEEKGPKDVICYIGDGINDAPSLIRADVGVAMGAIGTDAAVEAADVVLMRDNLMDIVTLRKISRRTLMIARENLVFSIAMKLSVVVLASLGITSMWYAVFADVGVALLAVLNALRVALFKPEA